MGRLFLWTAACSVIFSVGLIVGQHLLLQRSLPPLVNAAEQAEEQPLAVEAHVGQSNDKLAEELFSFYDALTTSELPATDSIESDHSADSLRGSHESDEDAAAAAEGESQPARFTIQVASHPTTERARAEMDRLRRLGLEPHLVAVDVPDHGKHYRVRIGKFATEDQARAHHNRLANEHNLQTFVTPL